MRRRSEQSVFYERSSGNVFADLGMPDSEELLEKAKLAHAIIGIIQRRGLTQTEAAEVLGIDQPKVSALVHGRLERFSLERLISFLRALDQKVHIIVSPRGRGKSTDVLSLQFAQRRGQTGGRYIRRVSTQQPRSFRPYGTELSRLIAASSTGNQLLRSV